MTRSLRTIGGIAALVALTVASCSSTSSSNPTEASSAQGRHAEQPNVVFILTDDLSWNLVNEQFTPHIADLQKRGATFDHYFVSDSLCCPSRSSILTGLYPHDTHVPTNLPPDGGFGKFQSEGLDRKTFATELTSAGYRTSLAGKYLNGYGDPRMTSGSANAPVPPGWSDWHASNATGYAELNYLLNDNGVVNSYNGPDNYGVDVLSRKARSFIADAAAAGKPFLAEVATFIPHAPYTPAPRNADDFPGLTQPRDPSFNANNVNPPTWLGERRPLGPKQVAKTDEAFRKRAQAMESVDRMVADVETELKAKGIADDTYIVFTSDNGYHLGQHRLARGKQTAFDTDIRVPLIVAGPGVPKGTVVHQVAQNVDLYPTFLDLAGRRPAPSVEGRSLVPLLQGKASDWRTIGLVEHQGADRAGDPDFEGGGSNPTTYQAIRISADHLPGFRGPVEAVYVEYQNAAHELEYYDIAKDPYEQRNVAGTLTPTQRATLHRALTRLSTCHDATTCWSAAHPTPRRS